MCDTSICHMALNFCDLAQTLNGIRGRFYHFIYEYIRALTYVPVYFAWSRASVFYDRTILFVCFFFLPRVRDHFRISLYCASSERQTARDRRHGINIDLRILPWSITREMTLAMLATIRLPGKSETLTVCYQIAERRRTVNVCVPRDMIAYNFYFFRCNKKDFE